MKRNTGKSGMIRAAAQSSMGGVVTSPAAFLGSGGRWATTQLKAAVAAGKGLTTEALRTLDTLRRDEWKYFDDVVLEEAYIRLVGVADLKAKGLQTTIANGLGKTSYEYEKMTAFDDAIVSMDGLAQSANDLVEYLQDRLPMPITHKDFFLNLRNLTASREKGEPLDTTNVRQATRVVNEASEKMLFQGFANKFGGTSIYGYMTHPDRNTGGYDGSKLWSDATKAGSSYLADVLNMLAAQQADRSYGPFIIYVPRDADVRLDNDFNAGTANPISIRQRLLNVGSISAIEAADQLPTGNVVMVQMTPDVVQWVEGEPLQTIQWDESGGMRLNFKVFTIGVPLVRSDAAGRSGIYHMHS
jgi:uncharacterized protein DUF6260